MVARLKCSAHLPATGLIPSESASKIMRPHVENHLKSDLEPEITMDKRLSGNQTGRTPADPPRVKLPLGPGESASHHYKTTRHKITRPQNHETTRPITRPTRRPRSKPRPRLSSRLRAKSKLELKLRPKPKAKI